MQEQVYSHVYREQATIVSFLGTNIPTVNVYKPFLQQSLQIVYFLYVIIIVITSSVLGKLPVPILWVTTRKTQPKTPEVVSVGEEQLPELEARWHAPRRSVIITAFDAVRVFVAFAVVYIGQGEGQARL